MVRALVENSSWGCRSSAATQITNCSLPTPFFLQAYDVVDEGQKLLAFYRLFELPATLIIDPVTGGCISAVGWVGCCPCCCWSGLPVGAGSTCCVYLLQRGLLVAAAPPPVALMPTALLCSRLLPPQALLPWLKL